MIVNHLKGLKLLISLAYLYQVNNHTLWMQGYFISKNNLCCTLIANLDIPKAACSHRSIYNTYVK